MSSIAVVLNTILYFLLFIVIWRKNKKIGVGGWLSLVYLTVAILCLNTYYSSPSSWQLSFLYFVYLFFVVLLFFIPLFKESRIAAIKNPIDTYNIKWYKLFTWFYICISLLSCIVYYPQFEAALLNPDWTDLYEASHEVKDSNIFTKFVNLFFHLRFLGVVLFFSFLSKKGVGKFFLILLGVGAFLPLIFVTIANASRGGIISIGFSVLLSFLMFKEIVPRNAKRVIYSLFLLVIPLAGIYFWSVTFSRFGDSPLYEDINDSMLYYAGHSMLCFNYGIMDSITGFADGGYMFDTSAVNNIKGTHFGTDFMTFVGCMYLDCGFIMSLILSLLVCLVMNSFMKKINKGIPEYFIILTYIMFLFNGVFVLPRGYAMQWVEAIVIYMLLKTGERIFHPAYKTTHIINN